MTAAPCVTALELGDSLNLHEQQVKTFVKRQVLMLSDHHTTRTNFCSRLGAKFSSAENSDECQPRNQGFAYKPNKTAHASVGELGAEDMSVEKDDLNDGLMGRGAESLNISDYQLPTAEQNINRNKMNSSCDDDGAAGGGGAEPVKGSSSSDGDKQGVEIKRADEICVVD